MSHEFSNYTTLRIQKSRVVGQVALSGAKNAALKLLAASLLTDGDIHLSNSPNRLVDMNIHTEMLRQLGKQCEVFEDTLIIREEEGIRNELLWNGPSIRNTLLILGALLSRTGYAKIPFPGGCTLGDRKYDLHVMLLEAMGATIREEDGYLVGEAPSGLRGTDIYLPIRSTGATENGIIAGCLAKGRTVVWGPHIRPEILDLITFLRRMGAKITVNGQESIIIDGVEGLSGAAHSVIPDNMEAITYLIAALVTGGEIELLNFPRAHLEVPLIFLKESGAQFFVGENSLIAKASHCYPIEIATGPYPGINSDMQPLFAVFALNAQGESRIVDLRFPDRYGYATELEKMGGRFKVSNNMLYAFGKSELKGAHVRALDLRCGAALVIAGLIAEGDTIISDAWQISRGYEDIDLKMQSLGCKVWRDK